MFDDVRSELRELVRARSFKRGNFTLSSGRESSLYFNMKPTMMSARGAELCARLMLEEISGLSADYVGGLEMGAVPVIGALGAISSSEGRPVQTIFVRKAPKSHGTKDLIEGLGPSESLSGKRVVVIDDVATSGKSILIAVEAVRSAGALVEHAVCLLDREEGATEMLASSGVALSRILTASEFA
jgi:orotate phosphoribosyltransferase